MHGIVLVDKPADISSARVVSRVKSAFKAQKAGHAGTLDPFATGLMICCLNRGTRLARFFLRGEKTYDAVLHLGVETDTQDFTGQRVAAHAVPPLTEEKIRALLQEFVGVSQQVPPAYSALKHKGLPLYAYARKGRPVEKPPRRIAISDIALRDIRLPQVRFEVTCSAGTYIRTLCSDIGKAIGCGAHLKHLRRLASSGFTVRDAVTLEALQKEGDPQVLNQLVIPPSQALRGMVQRTAEPRLKEKILNGVPLKAAELAPPDAAGADGLVKVLDDRSELLAVLEYKKERQAYDYCCVFN